MDLFGHVATTSYALLNAGMGYKALKDFLRNNAAKLCLTDTIRCKLVSSEEGFVKFGRIYSHFTNGAGIYFPINEELKEGCFSPDDLCLNSEAYVPSIADGPTDFTRFIETNPHIFTKANQLWGLCILTHLNQDVASDKVYQHLTADFGEAEFGNVLIHGAFEAKDKRVTYKLTRKEVSGTTFRQNIARGCILFHHYMVQQLINNFAIAPYNLIHETCTSFDEAYDTKMAESAKGYIRPNPLWFSDIDESGNSIVQIENEMIESGFCETSEQLNALWEMLLAEAIVACNPLLNEVVYQK